MSRKIRSYIYSILIALGPLASLYGFGSQEEIILWLGLGGTILAIPGGTLALRNLTPEENISEIPPNEE